MVLVKDIASTINPKHIYGYCGDEVKLIKDCGNVVIVEGANGIRFPLKAKQQDVIEIEIIEAVPDTTVQPIIINRVQVSKTKGAAPINQQSLF